MNVCLQVKYWLDNSDNFLLYFYLITKKPITYYLLPNMVCVILIYIGNES